MTDDNNTVLSESEQSGDMSIEEAFRELECIIKKLESRQLSLDESFDTYKEGMELLKKCAAHLDTVEKKVLQMTEEGELHEFW